jgi:hypothetical protein
VLVIDLERDRAAAGIKDERPVDGQFEPDPVIARILNS